MARASKTTETKKRGGIRWRVWAWVAAGVAACGVLGTALFQVRLYALESPQFRLSREKSDSLSISGLRHASRWRVQRVFAPDFGRSVFATPIEERRRRLLAIDWIEDASVMRVWPDRLSVEIRERKPVAFVFLRSSVLLIDEQGVLLEPPAQAQFTFPVLSGVREDETDEQRRERVRAMQRLLNELGYMAKDVSEVNAGDVDNMRIVMQVGGRAVELILGDANFAQRCQNFMTNYPEIRKRSPEVKSFDLRLDDRITTKE